MANSHQGDVNHGIEIIKAMGKIARKYNINAAVKLQYRNLPEFIHPDYRGRTDVPHVSRFESTRLSIDQFNELVEAIRAEEMIPMSTPFDEKGVSWCLDQGLPIIKIASCSATDWPLLEAVADSGKAIIVSTGGKSIAEIDNIYNFLVHRNCEFALMHCIAEYPVSDERLQLDFIDVLKKRYPGVPVGYSGHEQPDDKMTPAIAVAKGATILERHVGLPTETIKLNAYSMNPEQADMWVSTIISANNICKLKGAFHSRYISQSEIDSLNSLARGVYVNKNIQKGTKIGINDAFFAMPCIGDQMKSGDFQDGVTASRDYCKNDPVFENREVTDSKIAREIIHEAKGLLLESGIAIGKKYEVELSHHYGIRHLRQTGCIILTIINREYCKKLIIVLPGQKHPNHYHKIKEETFQLLLKLPTHLVGAVP